MAASTKWAQLKEWANNLRRDVHALSLAARDPRVPVLAKVIAFVVLAYALSPIDLIPDFIPVLGYLDELILLPAGLWLAVSLIPKPLFEEHQRSAAAIQTQSQEKPNKSWIGAVMVILTWIAASLLIIWLIVG